MDWPAETGAFRRGFVHDATESDYPGSNARDRVQFSAGGEGAAGDDHDDPLEDDGSAAGDQDDLAQARVSAKRAAIRGEPTDRAISRIGKHWPGLKDQAAEIVAAAYRWRGK
jgi:hypothetical protein